MSEKPKLNNPNEQQSPKEVDVAELLSKYGGPGEPDPAKIAQLNQEIAGNQADASDITNPTLQGEISTQPVNGIEENAAGEVAAAANESTSSPDEAEEAAERISTLGELIVERGVLYAANQKVDTRKAAEGEGFRAWSAYKEALVELGVNQATELSPLEVKDVIQHARAVQKLFEVRKREISDTLANNPDSLRTIGRAIGAARREYKRDNGENAEGFDAAAVISHTMKNPEMGLVSERTRQLDALLTPHAMRQLYYKAKDAQAAKTAEQQAQAAATKAPGELAQSTNEGEKQDKALVKEQITRAAAIFADKPELYAQKYRHALGEARYRYKKALVNTIDDSNMSPDEVNKLLAQKWRDEGVRVATAGVLQEMGLLEGVNLEGLSDKKLLQISNDFWHARARNLKQKSRGTKPEDGAGDLPKVDLSGLEPEKLTIAQQEERWMGLVQQHSVSNGDRGLKQQVDEAYNALQEMRSSPETLAELRQELSELSQQYVKQFDKNSPEARELARAATAKYNEIQALEQWQATNAESARAGKLPRVELPDDPLDADGAGRLPRVEFPDDPLMNEQTELKRQLDGIENQGSAEAVAIQQRLAEIYRQRLGLPPKEDEPKPLIGTESLKEQVRKQKEAELRAELGNTEYSTRYQAALTEYAELKAQSEIKGNGRFSWGKRKREVALLAASEKLAKAKAALEAQFIKSKEAAGMYDVSAEQLAQAKSDDLFNAMRTLDIEQRQATNDVLDTRAEKRNWLQKAAMRFAAMLDKGDKWPARLKAGGAGFGVGLLSTGLSWAGLWPVSIAVSAGITAGVRQAGVMVQRDKIHATENKDAQGNARTIVNDEKFAELKKRAVESGKDGFDAASQLAGDILEGAREIGYKQAERARVNNRRMTVAFGLGAAAGNLAGNLTMNAVNGAWGHGGVGKKGAVLPSEDGGGGDHEILKGTQFSVEKGHGLIRELREFATTNGHKLTPVQAESLHHDLIKAFGKDYIDIHGVKHDVYMHGGDVRLSAPGKANWEDGVPEFIKRWMDRKGLWK